MVLCCLLHLIWLSLGNRLNFGGFFPRERRGKENERNREKERGEYLLSVSGVGEAVLVLVVPLGENGVSVAAHKVRVVFPRHQLLTFERIQVKVGRIFSWNIRRSRSENISRSKVRGQTQVKSETN